MPVRGKPLRRLGFLTIGRFDATDPRPGHEQTLRLIEHAEELGFDSVWVAESYGSDVVSVLAWLAPQTETIKLGSAIFQMPGRSPAMTAMTAATFRRSSEVSHRTTGHAR